MFFRVFGILAACTVSVLTAAWYYTTPGLPVDAIGVFVLGCVTAVVFGVLAWMARHHSILWMMLVFTVVAVLAVWETSKSSFTEMGALAFAQMLGLLGLFAVFFVMGLGLFDPRGAWQKAKEARRRRSTASADDGDAAVAAAS